MSTTADMIELKSIWFTMEGSYLFETRRSSSCDSSEDGITTQLSKCIDGALLDLRQVQIKHDEETDGVSGNMPVSCAHRPKEIAEDEKCCQ